jgi:hypothetical protein
MTPVEGEIFRINFSRGYLARKEPFPGQTWEDFLAAQKTIAGAQPEAAGFVNYQAPASIAEAQARAQAGTPAEKLRGFTIPIAQATPPPTAVPAAPKKRKQVRLIGLG